jgi:hypothetical protein
MGPLHATRIPPPGGTAIRFARLVMLALLVGSCSHDWSGSDGPSDGLDGDGDGEAGGETGGDGEVMDEAGESAPEAVDVDDVEVVEDDGGVLCGNSVVDPGEECDGDDPHDCVTGCGTLGQRACLECLWSHDCTPPPETCNGVDDDCDTVVDDTFDCTGTATRACITGCGSTGTSTCTADCTWGTCIPPVESCNALDDDCDGATDETFPCIRGRGVSCENLCLVPGTQTCSSDCTLPLECCAPSEHCDCGVCDDDCDTVTDEGCPIC